jgi:outer membrane protein assembly factor BamB
MIRLNQLRMNAHRWFGCMSALAVVMAARGALGQMVQATMVNPLTGTDTDNSSETDKAPGFSVHKEQRPVADAFEDFERYRDKKAWEKAFAALGKIDEGKPGHLVAAKDGFLVPTELKVRAELLSLPADGREAYRLFNDAKAAQLLHAVTVSGPGEIPTLTKIVNRYFITSVGDQAADQLGDALFEAGDFPNAQHCWQMIIENFPDSSLSPAQLQTKRAMALARCGQWEQFEAVRATIHDRYAGQSVQIGGHDVVAGDFVDSLKSQSAPTTKATLEPSDYVTTSYVYKLSPGDGPLLPATDQPVWQIPIMDVQASSQLIQQLGQSGWAAMAGQFTQAVPATVVDEKRVYVNWLGICFACDLKNGKLLWRTDTFGDMTQKMAQAMMQGIAIDPQVYSATLCNDKVIFTRRATDNQNYNELPMTRLHCLSAEAGKMVWKTDSGPLATWGFVGQPLLSGDVFYMIAHSQGSQELSLLCIGTSKGDLRWQASLGTPAPSMNYRGQPTVPAPTLLLRSGKIMVLTNNGALLQLDCGTHQVEWAFSYPTYVETQQQFYGYAMPSPVIAPGTLLWFGPTLYFKEYNSNVAYAMDPSGPTIQWKRRIDPDAGIASCDGNNIILAGPEIECLDCQSRALLWADKTSTRTGAMRPVLQGDWMYFFGSKGIDSVRLSTGETGPKFKGYDREADGGVLWKTANRLVTVSSRAITAYPLSHDTGTGHISN